MPIVQDLGVALGFTSNTKWSLTSLDNPNLSFTGQFAAENVVENVGARLPETTSTGQQVPVISAIGSEVETISFRARIFRTSPVAGAVFDALSDPVGTAFNVFSGGGGPLIGNGSVRDQIEMLKNFARPDSKLGRQHRFTLNIGTELQFDVFVKSPGRIAYDDIRSDGTIRGASFDMQLIKIRPENVQPESGISTAALIKTTLGVATTVAGAAAAAGLIDIPGASLHTIDKVIDVKEGDTFEKIAAREYGNPLLGDILRRAQPDKLDLKVSTERRLQIVTIKRNEITQIAVEPQSIPLRSNQENKQLLEEFLALRGSPTSLVI